MKSVPPLRVAPRASRVMAALATIGAMSSAGLVLWLALPRWAAALGVGSCSVLLASCFARLRRTPRLVVIGIDRHIWVTDEEGRTCEGTILGSTYVSALFTAVVWRPQGRWRTNVWSVVPDVLPAEDRRRLRVWLRYGAPPGAESVSADAVEPDPSRARLAGAPLNQA